MSELMHCTVEDIALEMGDAPFGSNLKTKDYTDSGALVVQGKNVQGRCFNWSDKRHVSFEKYESIPRSHCFPGDLIFPKVGTIGKVGILSSCDGYDKYILSTNTMRLKVDPEKANPLFIYYYFTWSRTVNLIHAMNSKSVQPVFNFTTLKKFPLELPSLEIQNEVGRIIGELDNKIELNRQTNETLEHIAQAIFKSWFVDFEPSRAKIAAKQAGQDPERAAMAAISGKTIEEIDQLAQEHDVQGGTNVASAGSARATYEQLKTTAALFPDALVDSELGEMPEGWDIKKIGDVVERLKPSKRYTKKQVEPFGMIPVYEQGADILLGYHNDEPGFRATPEEPLFIFGDHTCVIHLSCDDFDISQNVIPLSGLGYPTTWVYYAIQGKQEFQEYRRHWSEFVIKDVLCPEKTLTQVYSDIVTSLYKHKEQSVKENKELEQLRDTLLPRLLSGQSEDGEVA